MGHHRESTEEWKRGPLPVQRQLKRNWNRIRKRGSSSSVARENRSTLIIDSGSSLHGSLRSFDVLLASSPIKFASSEALPCLLLIFLAFSVVHFVFILANPVDRARFHSIVRHLSHFSEILASNFAPPLRGADLYKAD